MFEIQYAGRLAPDTSYMCLSWDSRSLISRAIVTVGMIARAIEMIVEKSIA